MALHKRTISELGLPVHMVTALGHEINFLHPELYALNLEDIAIHTKNMCRYNGAINWRLVQHLALCYTLAAYDNIKNNRNELYQIHYCAAHDLHEAIVQDVVTGLKKVLPEYQIIENKWEARIHDQLMMPLEAKDHDFVKQIDMRALAIEMYMNRHPGFDYLNAEPITQHEKNIYKSISMSSYDLLWSELRGALMLGVNTK